MSHDARRTAKSGRGAVPRPLFAVNDWGAARSARGQRGDDAPCGQESFCPVGGGQAVHPHFAPAVGAVDEFSLPGVQTRMQAVGPRRSPKHNNVAGLQPVARHRPSRSRLVGGDAGHFDAVLQKRPIDEAGTVEPLARGFAAGAIGSAELGGRRTHHLGPQSRGVAGRLPCRRQAGDARGRASGRAPQNKGERQAAEDGEGAGKGLHGGTPELTLYIGKANGVGEFSLSWL